jgi:large repetitive protein
MGVVAALLACNTSMGTNGTMLVYPGPTNVSWDGSYDFGNVGIGLQSPPATFTIENDGFASIVFSGATPVSVTGTNAADFAVSQPAISTVARGLSTTFTVQFNPSVVAKETAQVAIASAAGSYTFTVSGGGVYSGTLSMSYSTDGSSPPTSLPPAAPPVTFPALAAVDGFKTVAFIVTDSSATDPLALIGNTPVVVTNATGAFSVVTKPVSPVQPQGSTQFVIQETYLGPGTYTETVTVKTSDSSGPFTFTITGTQS